MNRHLTFALGIAIAAAAAAIAIASGPALADDITIDKTPFVSTMSRADVKSGLLNRAGPMRYGANEGSAEYNEVPQLKSSYTSEQAKADYIAARREVRELNGEDSGSSYFTVTRARGNPTSTMGAPAR